MGNKVGKAIDISPSVLYSLIGEMPIGVQSMEGGTEPSAMCKKHLISSILVLEFGCVEIKEEDCNSWGSREFGNCTVKGYLCS